MVALPDLLRRLDHQHRAALAWLDTRRETVVPWSDLRGRKVVTSAKGIYKPAWSDYSLTVRKAIGSGYVEPEPRHRRDGSWWWLYHQEDPDTTGIELFTNRGLMHAMDDRVPVAALWQVSKWPYAEYRVLGLSLVTAYRDRYFLLEGFDASGTESRQSTPMGEAFDQAGVSPRH